MAAAVPTTASRLAEAEPDRYPPVEQVWAEWLYGEHAPGHRRRVLDEFASDFFGGPVYAGRDVRAELRVLSSVRVLGEGVDTAECDAVLFSDARGSMVDIVQMVGRALRLHPERGKLATLIVPVFLGPDEDPNEMLTSDAYSILTKILSALRSHDAETVEALADPRLRNSRPGLEADDTDEAEASEEEGGQDDDGEDQEPVSARALGVLRFSEERDPAVLTQFVQLRVINPEKAYWLRGIEAATRWLRETNSSELRVPFTYVTPEEWGSVGGHPLGVWLADQRRYYREGTLEASRVAELEKLGMVWSVHASAWEAGLDVARAYAALHGHCLPAAAVVFDGFALGVFMKNARAGAKRARENAARRANGETGLSYAGELSQERREALDEIDPGWCPEWDIAWQRNLRLLLAHVKAGGTLPACTGEVVAQGEDLGAWIAAQRTGWDKLVPAQQWLLESIGIDPDEAVPARPAVRSQADRWETNLTAARQYHARKGHLRPARKHVETVGGQEIKLGAWLDNTRRRAATLSPERRAALSELGMRW